MRNRPGPPVEMDPLFDAGSEVEDATDSDLEPDRLPEPEPSITFATPEPASEAQSGALASDIPGLLQLTGCRGPLVALFGGAIFGHPADLGAALHL